MTDKPVGWTLDTLHEYLISKIDALAELTAAESRASKEAISAALIAVREQSSAAVAASEKAILKAETATEKRFDSVNEFRKTLSDQAANFLARNEYDANHKSLEEKIIMLSDRVGRTETQRVSRAEGMSAAGAMLLGTFAVISALTSVASVIFVLTRAH